MSSFRELKTHRQSLANPISARNSISKGVKIKEAFEFIDEGTVTRNPQSIITTVGNPNTIRKSIARASLAFNLPDCTETGDVLIENDRLRTSVAIINGKLKS